MYIVAIHCSRYLIKDDLKDLSNVCGVMKVLLPLFITTSQGDALLFYSMNPDGTQDPYAMHTGCPVVSGLKWTGTIWIHPEPFRPDWMKSNFSAYDLMDPGDCRDYHPRCSDWAKLGECDKNKPFMVKQNCTVTFCSKNFFQEFVRFFKLIHTSSISLWLILGYTWHRVIHLVICCFNVNIYNIDTLSTGLIC